MRYDVVLLPLLALLLGSLLAWLGELGDETWHRGVGRKTVAVVMALPLLYAAGTTVCYVSAMARPDVRDQALDWLRKHVEAGSSLGLIWAPWFNVPPVDYVNGGEVLRRNPLFAGLIRSPWEIRVIGYDAGKLRAERPDFLVLSEFELRDFVRAREPKALELLGAVKEEYGVAARFVRRPIGPAWTKNPPQDWLYPFPELRVLESQEGAGELGE